MPGSRKRNTVVDKDVVAEGTDPPPVKKESKDKTGKNIKSSSKKATDHKPPKTDHPSQKPQLPKLPDRHMRTRNQANLSEIQRQQNEDIDLERERRQAHVESTLVDPPQQDTDTHDSSSEGDSDTHSELDGTG